MSINFFQLPPEGKTPYGNQILVFSGLYSDADYLEEFEPFVIEHYNILIACYAINQLSVLENVADKLYASPKLISLLDKVWLEWLDFINLDNNTRWKTLLEMVKAVGVSYNLDN